MYLSTLVSIVLLFFFTYQVGFVVAAKNRTRVLNDRPVIGILAQEISYYLNEKYPNQYSSYIAASYVKFVEGAGALPVPIWIGKDEKYYEDILSKVNGIIFPGGNTCFKSSKPGYAEAGATIYRIAKRLNDEGNYFPILGICLGFELLTYLAAENVEHRTDCSSSNQQLPLEFQPDFRSSHLFSGISSSLVNILSKENVTQNNHQYCVTKNDLRRVKLTNKFRVMSLNHDTNDLEFISTLEHVDYPFYGVQFHPEKTIYEWKPQLKIPHSANAIRASRFFADFFINEARKNSQGFKNFDNLLQTLIYNYPVTYTGLVNSAFLQCYMFK